jgi:hypothetical protein
MIIGLIFRVTNPTISNETDKTRTDPGPAVLFYLPWIFAGICSFPSSLDLRWNESDSQSPSQVQLSEILPRLAPQMKR